MLKHVCYYEFGCLFATNYRNIMRLSILMQELWFEMWHDVNLNEKSKVVTKSYFVFLIRIYAKTNIF